MPRAVWNGAVLAQSDDTVVVEGNHYFPRDAVDDRYVVESSHTSVCPWKGTASYLTIEVDGSRNENAAWYYPSPSRRARAIEGRVAFWKGVRVESRGEVTPLWRLDERVISQAPLGA
jgi:uncharacterized protein (DUF427 family)